MEPQNTNVMMNQPTRSPIGPVIGLIVILAIIIVGGLYFWGERVNETATIDTAPTVQEQQTENVFETQGSLDCLLYTSDAADE